MPPTTGDRRERPWRMARTILAIWLLTAAALKAWAMARAPTQLAPVPLPSVSWPILIGLEMLWGAALLASLAPDVLRRRRLPEQRARSSGEALLYSLTVAGFTALACVAAWFSYLNLPSCGCFGPISLPPWLALVADGTAIAILFVCKPSMASLRSWFRGAGCGAAAGIVAVGCLAGAAPHRLSELAPLPVEDGVVIVVPDKWEGKRFPLLDYIDAPLAKGAWRVLLIHHNCPKCRDRMAAAARGSAGHGRLAFIEVPPFGPTAQGSEGEIVVGRLSDRFEWYVATPLTIDLRDGVVVRCQGL